jgi:hypothetical protein
LPVRTAKHPDIGTASDILTTASVGLTQLCDLPAPPDRPIKHTDLGGRMDKRKLPCPKMRLTRIFRRDREFTQTARKEQDQGGEWT